jgi:hypothetical protein
MPLSEKEQRDRQIQMFGMPLDDVRKEKPPIYKPGMWAMSILSDVQELLAAQGGSAGAREQARQWINKAKFWIDVCESGGEENVT